MNYLINLSILLSYVSLTLSHSWLACSDYRIDSTEDARVFNSGKCAGYGRNYKNGHKTDVFGGDTGYDFRPSSNNGNTCKYPLTNRQYSNFYSNEVPMARYRPGQRVCIAWPSKNHVAATCNNPFIPDNGLKIYMSEANPESDKSVSAMRLIHDFGANSRADEFKGFQNCPNFCANADKSTCSGCFNIPNDVQPGSVHSFVWSWAFNGPEDLYSSCWEAQIIQGDGNQPSTTARTESTTARAESTTGRAVSTTGRISTTGRVSTTADEQIPNEGTTGEEFPDESTTSDEQIPKESTTDDQFPQPSTTAGSTTSSSQTGNTVNGDPEAIACSRNEDCPTNVCEVGGFCQKKQGMGLPVILAIAFGGVAFLAIVVAVLAVLFRYKLKRLPYF